MLRLLKFVNKIRNIGVKKYSVSSSINNVARVNSKRFFNYTLTRNSLNRLSNIFAVAPDVTALNNYYNEITLDSLKTKNLINISNDELNQIPEKIHQFSCEELIVLLIGLDSLDIPLHHASIQEITIALSNQMANCNFLYL